MDELRYFPRELLLQAAHQVYMRNLELDPSLTDQYDQRQLARMYEDVFANLQQLDAAMDLDDARMFPEHVAWVLELMQNLMPKIPSDVPLRQMVLHLRSMDEVLRRLLPAEFADRATLHLQRAISRIETPPPSGPATSGFATGRHAELRARYLALLLEYRNKEALHLIQDTAASGVPMEQILLEVLRPAQIELGRLWYTRKIGVDVEHIGTSTTQQAMALCFPEILRRPGGEERRVLACCVGNELHEVGIRMITDLFELRGWDCLLLGSSVPTPAVLDALRNTRPALVVLSVTLPRHLPICLDIVRAIHREGLDVKIAVGGRAFASTDGIWSKWDIDFYSDDAVDLIDWAERSLPR